tara:strand:+ start:5576 stop:7753 length:2178 start_codon:yes stop_codon:yes gene_type:complete
MNVIQRILNAPVVMRKGEGIFRKDPETGEPTYIGNPHEHLFHDNEENPLHASSSNFSDFGIDVPLHAHLGDRTPTGNWSLGKHGEIVWTDAYGHTHRHGIDGVIHQLGEMGVKDPIGLVRKAIQYTNENHEDPDNHQLPGPEDPAWRMLVGHKYNPAYDIDSSMKYPFLGKGGTLATVNMSQDPEASKTQVKLGQHPESYRIGFAPVLRKLLEEEEGITIADGDFKPGITHPYTSGGYLSFDAAGVPVVRRLRQKMGETLTEQGLLPHKVATDLGLEENHPMPFQEGVHTWEMFHTLPALLHHPDLGKMAKEGSEKRAGGRRMSAAVYQRYLTKKAPEMLANTPPELLDTNILNTQNGGTISLRDALTDETSMGMLVNQLLKSPAALAFLLGNSKQGGPADFVLSQLEEKALKDMKPEERENFKNIVSGVTPGQIPAAQSKNSHEHAARLFALAHVMDSQEMKNHGFTPDEEQHPWYGVQDGLFSVLADSLAHAHGHQPRRELQPIPDYSDITLPKGLAESMDASRPLDPHWQEKLIPEMQTHQMDMVADDAPVEPVSPDLARPHSDDKQNYFRDRFPTLTPEEQMKVMNYFIDQGTYKHPQGVIGATGLPMLTPEEQLQHFTNVVNPPGRIATSFDTVSIEDRIVKGMEKLQRIQARGDVAVLKQVSEIPVDTDRFSFLANKMGLQKQDIRAIAHSKGDWTRVAKAYNTKPVLVKAVKLSLEDE